MKYMGSKRRIAKEILPIILQNRTEEQWYVEPFCGGCNVIDKVDGNRLANDIHTALISMFSALQQGWLPPKSVTEVEYYAAKLLPDTDLLKGFILFCCSFAGKWCGGYAREVGSDATTFATRGYNNITTQMQHLSDVTFTNLPYTELVIPDNSIIYCDPPYANTTKYKHTFDHNAFYEWCRLQKQNGHTVYISEYTMPDDFICVWQKEQTTNLDNNRPAKIAIEKLFTL